MVASTTRTPTRAGKLEGMHNGQRLIVDVKSAKPPISGQVVDPHGSQLPFVGWLAFLSTLDRAIATMAEDNTPLGQKIVVPATTRTPPERDELDNNPKPRKGD